MPQNNLCKAKFCSQRIQPGLLMCSNHWAKVPKYYKMKINELYTSGQEIDKKLLKKKYLYYSAKARNAVAYKEHVEMVKMEASQWQKKNQST